MTREEFIRRIATLRHEERLIKRKVSDLKKEFEREFPFKIDDMVSVGGYKGWIKEIYISDSAQVSLVIFTQRKNGERSKNTRTLWYRDWTEIKLCKDGFEN